MNKFGRRILAALITSSLVVTPVFAAPSVDDLQKSKASAQSEVNSLQSQLQSIVSKLILQQRVKRLFRRRQIWSRHRKTRRHSMRL